MPSIPVDVVDAVELAETLQFISDWLATEQPLLGASLTRFGIVRYSPFVCVLVVLPARRSAMRPRMLSARYFGTLPSLPKLKPCDAHT